MTNKLFYGDNLDVLRDHFGRHNIGSLDTTVQMTLLAKGLDGKRLRYGDLVAGL